MKNIKLFKSSKYSGWSYKKVSEGIYKKKGNYYMSLSFEQEPEFDEGADASDISQYPLEDILDKYLVYVSDFYLNLNIEGQKECYIEVSSDELDCLEQMKGIIGKHVFNKTKVKDGEEFVDLVIE